MTARRSLRRALPLALLGFLVAVPYISAGDLLGILPGSLDSPGTLQLLGLMLVFGGVALTYDLLFGYTGLLSFGHALYFAIGVYLIAIATTKWNWELWEAVLLTAAIALVVATVLGSVSLRVGGIAFAMVTLAFAQAGSILALQNPHKWTGGEEGVAVNYLKLPDWLVGILNTKNLYWLALAYAALVFVVAAWAVDSSPGRVWQAIRENELRVEVLGLRPFSFKLQVFVLGSFLAALGGIVYALLLGGASTEITTPSFTLSLLIMVVLGGAGTRWGAMLGGVLYTLLDQRLADWTSTGATGRAIQDAPRFIHVPLSQPLFVLGVLFILLVFFVPGGIAGLLSGHPRRHLRALEGILRREEKAADEEIAGTGVTEA
jgi:branched-chain amino acid transport system permease protein